MRSLSDLRDYQHKAYQRFSVVRRGYLAAKAGAGKTAVALRLAHYVLHDAFETDRILVVGPKRVVTQWPTEAKGWDFAGHLRFSVYVGDKAQRDQAISQDSDVVCCSFEFFAELVDRFTAAEWPFGLVIYDEASRLRQGGRKGAVGWKCMNSIARKTNARILMMSGSPRPGTAHELFAPVAILDGGARLGTTLTAFRAAYLEPNKQNRHTGQVYSWKCRAGMEPALYDRISDIYYAVAPDLGLESVVIDRPVVLPDRAAKAIRDLIKDQVLDLDDLELVAASQGTVAGKAHQMCQGAVFEASGAVKQLHNVKLDELAEIIEEVDAPMIVCYWYSHDAERLKERFPDAVDITTEQGLADAKAGKVKLALLHPASAAHGIDGLQFVFDYMVWFCIPASFELYDQACKRIVRSGRTGTATIYRIVATNGVADVRMIQRLAEKEAEQDSFFSYLEGKQ
jgi:SNF2-related domain